MKKIILLSLFLISIVTHSQNISKTKEDKNIHQVLYNQSNDVKATFNVYLDNKKVETDSVLIGSIYDSSTKTYSVINDQFDTFLLPNRVYNMIITHPNYNKQILKIITDKANEKLKVNIYLSSKDPDCYLGYYKYNKLLKKYIKYE